VRHVSCGSYAAVALTTDGAAFTWGKGARGVLGHGHTRDVASPTRVGALSGTFVWDARLGKAFLLCLSAAGELFSNGAADGGVLGHGARADEAAPLRVAALEGTRVVGLDCGDSHAAALTASGEVYCWGRGSHGRLGLGHSRDVPTPTRVEAMVARRPCTTALHDGPARHPCATCPRAHVQPTSPASMHPLRAACAWVDGHALVLACHRAPLPPRTPQVGKTCVEISCASYATACRTDTGHVWRWGGKWDSAVPRTARLLGHLRLAPQALGCATHSARAAEPGRAQGRLRCDPEGGPGAWTPPRSTPRRWGGSAVAPLEPMRIRLGGSARCVAAGGSHVAVALGELLGDAADRSLARQASCCCTSTACQCAPHVTCTARHVHRTSRAPHVTCIARHVHRTSRASHVTCIACYVHRNVVHVHNVRST
jgi:hypothetical protein